MGKTKGIDMPKPQSGAVSLKVWVQSDNQNNDQTRQVREIITRLGHQSLPYSLSIEADQLSFIDISGKNQQKQDADCIIFLPTQPLSKESLNQQKPILSFVKELPSNITQKFLPNQLLCFVESYEKATLKHTVQDFLNFVVHTQRRSGKLIVIEGADGAGKRTQSERLQEALKKQGKVVESVDFPRYYTSFHGQTISRYLQGEFGDVHEVSPYLVSLAYALDRLTMRDELYEFLEEGKYIISNRYIPSNMAFQSAKLPDDEQDKFLSWIYELEYKKHKMPESDIVIYLSVPWEISQKLIEKKHQRQYLQGQKKDIHEKNTAYLQKTQQIYEMLVDRFDHWVKIDCTNNQGNLLSIEQIHQKIIKVLKNRQIL